MAPVTLKTIAQVPTAASIDAWKALLICDVRESCFQRSGGYLLHKCTIFREKKFHASLKV